MSASDTPPPFSILDRLIADKTSSASEQPSGRVKDKDQLMREWLRRDLEDLLNTHRYGATLDAQLQELPTSLLAMGTTGFYGLMLATPEQQKRMGRSLEELIRNFEPRLSRPRVVIEKLRNEVERSLSIKISGALSAAMGGGDIEFKTRLDAATRQFFITSVHND